ncbi:MAG: M23 family metallopeptidase [Dermatophilaceae bacterium]
MSSEGHGSGVRNAGLALLLVPAFFVVFLLGIVFTSYSTSQADGCGPAGGAALTVDPASVPPGPIAGYGREQLVNAAQIMLAAQQLRLSARDQQIGVMTAMGESSLRVLDRGDAVGPDSRGLFQQRANGAWGSYADRMDPFTSATSFFKVEMTIAGREAMEPTLVAHTVQRNADPYHYAPFWEPAGAVVTALGGIKDQAGASSAAGSAQSRYDLGPVQPQTATVANTVGPMFGIKTVGGYRPATPDQRDPNGHPAGLALDFMTNDIPGGTATGDRLAKHLQDNAADLGVKYIIWRQRIWSVERADEGWRPMTDRGSVTENHFDHVHLSLTGTGAAVGADPACTAGGVAGVVALSGWAAPSDGPLTSDFGPRSSPGGIGSTYHRGIDLAPGCRKPIWAANTGQVVRAGPATGLGNVIEVDHGSGISTRYGHMYDDGLLARVGDQVRAGQQIAEIGNTGNSTGCHLHFEVLMNGQQVDPEAFLAQVGVTIK